MFPLRVQNPVSRTPVITWLLIAVNVVAFLLMGQVNSPGFQRNVIAYGNIPANLFHRSATTFLVKQAMVAVRTADGEIVPLQPELPKWFLNALAKLDEATLAGDAVDIEVPRSSSGWDGFGELFPRNGGYDSVHLAIVHPAVPAWLTPFTSMFMHAGWLHLLGNMWFLLLFGPSVEDILGRWRYFVFYLATGLAADALQVAVGPGSFIPMLGASGAISGVLGGFMLRLPRAEVLTLVPWFEFFATPMNLPALVFLGLYIGGQVLMGFAGLSMPGAGAGGVAYFAHIGGFLGGLLLMAVFPPTDRWSAQFVGRRPTTGRRFGYEYADGAPAADNWYRT